MLRKIPVFFVFLIAFSAISSTVFAQPAWTIDLLGKQKKPKQFENRKLGSEKLAEKKFTPVRHFFQNNFTHYNYFFNANNRINSVVERAKIAQVDDFSKLLPFHSFSLDNTASQAAELDSVILKSTAGILLHDLRNDWIDNMYLLMGQAYFYRKDFDSAAATFQFINLNLVPRKKNDDDDKIIGTNYDASKSTLSIANKEKRNIVQKVFSQPPSRNDAILWLARTLIEKGDQYEAVGLIKTLQNDPNFPKRLQNDLDELYAYWFYAQGSYDSAAVYLEKGLTASDTKQDKARSEFLLAQMYESVKQFDKAEKYYSKAASHTTNPMLDIYANLNKAKMNTGEDAKALDKSIDNLVHMSKKDKFEGYKEIIFYAAGELALQKPDTTQAMAFYKKSALSNENNPSYKNKALLRMADISFDRKDFKQSLACYDSLQTGDTALNSRSADIMERRNALSEVVAKIVAIEREDSLQRIAALPPLERDAIIKKLSKKLRKEHGLTEDEPNQGALIDFNSNKEKSIDLFSNNSTKGDWYFYNSSLKSKGAAEFKARWGQRSNVDNWRRKAAIDAFATSRDMSVISPDGLSPDDIVDNQPKKDQLLQKPGTETKDYSYNGLLSELPLNEEKMAISQNTIAVNLFDLAQLYQNRLEDYGLAIDTYNESLRRFPDSLYDGELYMGLYYCYYKLGLTTQAQHYKNLINKNFPESHASKVFTNPDEANPNIKTDVATQRYGNIYNLFIEGNFEKALEEKKKADSIYGKNYWSPQLLYIESIYHIKQKDDSTAIDVLKDITTLYPTSPLSSKAETMIDVLGRRAEIEKYLTELEITRAAGDSTVMIIETKTDPVLPANQVVKDSTAKTAPQVAQNLPAKQDVTKAPVVKEPEVTSGPFVLNVNAPHNVVMILNKIDPTYVNETKNAFNRYNGEKYRSLNLAITKEPLDNDNTLLVTTSFNNAEEAIAYCEKIRRAASAEVSWLPANKYSFIICDNANLEKLRANKDLNGYINLLQKQYPDKF